MDLNEFMRSVHETAVSKGWWGDELASGESLTYVDRNVGEMLMLVTTEIAEAYEEWRSSGNGIFEAEAMLGVQYRDGKPEGFTVELADALIRIFDICERFQLPLVEALEIKAAYNATRPYRHGGKHS